MSRDNDPRRQRVVELVTRAEVIVERLETQATDGRWAMTAFSRYRLCELLQISPSGSCEGDLEVDPAALLEEAALTADELDGPVEDLGRLQLGDALRTAASDIRAVCDARDV
ncbi:hypothetical protein HPO96_35050 [Kribbella sandramycini]|uniref:Uncharacterized protein n=1 Tax=Kribbella sandramycini TaxID=60450 RepID=A0A7Y4L6W5_9ACTN|nr:hypothetical protein [Kribbella sandramycini]MBB6566691.1 hypothetical protein [Kribbella sandramycini]NOL45479.1 hypothetical protein [Kribbella sandramycini]